MLIGDVNDAFSPFDLPPAGCSYPHLFCRNFDGLPLISLLPDVESIRDTPRRETLLRLLQSCSEVSLALYTTEHFEYLLKEPGEANVAVVVPTYNIAGFVRATLESIRRQTDPNITSLIVDDGSSDGTDAIALEDLNAHSSVMSACLLQIPHVGWPSVSRNVALYNLVPKNAGYITFMDGDDLYADPNAIGALKASLENHPRAFAAYGDYDWISESGAAMKPAGELVKKITGGYAWKASRSLTWKNLALGNHGVLHFQTLMVRKGVPFIPYHYRGQDSSFYAHLFKRSAELYEGQLTGIIQVPSLVCHYRVRGKSISNDGVQDQSRVLETGGQKPVKGWQRPDGVKRYFDDMGIPECYLTDDTISLWLAKQWVNEALRAMFRGNFPEGLAIIKASLRDVRVTKRHLIFRGLRDLATQLGHPRVLVETVKRARSRLKGV
ncbi:glycosyltransferase family A protein [Thiocapsa bogorovii]|uniref:glycosyltransferase family A protein n=1 Tax=Thiocapsa bogorovii TaxID=521689 RepID=UPI001E4AE08D|nr:glycosyltransferase family A protein [Thiocapsa bogorovii]UHD17120.1 glycosyltransferase family 2 protein [Thiocapsa bogorovii]